MDGKEIPVSGTHFTNENGTLTFWNHNKGDYVVAQFPQRNVAFWIDNK